MLNNEDCLASIASYTRSLGKDTKIVNSVYGDVYKIATRLAKLIPKNGRSCIIFGGESTVKICNTNGIGGRNQEMVLHSALPEVKPRQSGR